MSKKIELHRIAANLLRVHAARVKDLGYGIFAVQGTVIVFDEDADSFDQLDPEEQTDALKFATHYGPDRGVPVYLGSSYSTTGDPFMVGVIGQVKKISGASDPTGFFRSLPKLGNLFTGTKFITGNGSSEGLWQRSNNEFILYLGDDD